MHAKARTDSLIVQEMDGETLVYDRKTGRGLSCRDKPEKLCAPSGPSSCKC